MANITQEIVVQKLNEWTKALTPKESRISIFEHIRDIPYAIVPGLGHPVHGPARMLNQNRGYCEPKHILMHLMYQRLRIPVRYVTYPFRWSAQNIDYPWKLEKLAEKMPTGYHLACKVCIKREWVLVDATWDLPLRKHGFPVNKSWDGVSHTFNAVKPEEEVVHESASERMKYIRARAWSLLTLNDKLLSRRFYNGLNMWLQQARISKSRSRHEDNVSEVSS